uniref:Expressed conserved protein n=1 Tax=Echinococcus granulosus TaxID=6210 RepID=A0A068WLD0_ECHGR|nr:expressed conserved protein [Echinococcus granulosus]
MYLLHPSPTPPTEEEKKRLLPPVEEYMQSVLGQVPGDIELLELVSEMDRGCFYGVKVSCFLYSHASKVKFGEQLWHMQLYHSPIIYGIDIIALKHHAAQEDERLHPQTLLGSAILVTNFSQLNLCSRHTFFSFDRILVNDS